MQYSSIPNTSKCNSKHLCRSPPADSKQSDKSYRSDLQAYFSKKNLGLTKYKIASIGNKGKERYKSVLLLTTHNKHLWRFMATVFVENDQYKTYPDTFPSQLEAEEALANMVLTKLGELT